jgi:hypothetical protein
LPTAQDLVVKDDHLAVVDKPFVLIHR